MFEPTQPSRRNFLKTTAAATAAAAAANAFIARSAYASSDETVKVALIGCGGRGSGACAQALSTSKGPIKLVSMADAFQDRLESAHKNLKVAHPEQVDVKDDKKFVGFDAYKNAVDSGA